MLWGARAGARPLERMSCVAGTITTVHRLAGLRLSPSSSSMLALPRLLMLMIVHRSCMNVLLHVNLKLSSVTSESKVAETSVE